MLNATLCSIEISDRQTKKMISVIPCNPKKLNTFYLYPYTHYKNTPRWIPPLKMDLSHKYNLNKNPFFKKADAMFWLAKQHDRIVGRIAAFINYSHLEKYNDQCGHFGCFEAESAEVGRQLVAHASQWLRENGMTSMVGPYDFSINEISGLLIEGYDKDPAIMMPYNPPTYPEWFESYGLSKAKDTIAYKLDVRQPLSENATRFIELSKRKFPVTIRCANKSQLLQDIRTIFEIFNKAWTKNWGSIPLSAEEINDSAKAMKLIAIPDAALFASYGTELIGILAALPNINSFIKKYNGRLFPFNIIDFLRKIKVKNLTSYRVCLGGVMPQYVDTKISSLVFIQLVDELLRRAKSNPSIQEIEISWVLEDNFNLISMLDTFGATRDKVYRIYSKPL